MIFFKHALKRSFGTPINLIVLFLLPIPIIFIPRQFGLHLYGMINLYSAFLLCRPLIEDRQYKTILRIASSPNNYMSYLGSYLVAFIIILTGQNLLFLLINFIYWQEGLDKYLVIFCLYLTYSFLTITFSLFWNSLFKDYKLSFGLFSGIGSVLCLFSGISIPFQVFPENLKKAVMIVPLHWLPYGLDALNNGKINYVLISVLIMLILTVIFFMIGSKRRY